MNNLPKVVMQCEMRLFSGRQEPQVTLRGHGSVGGRGRSPESRGGTSTKTRSAAEGEIRGDRTS